MCPERGAQVGLQVFIFFIYIYTRVSEVITLKSKQIDVLIL